ITAVHVAYFVTQHLLVIAVTATAVVALLEWRSSRWPRYRRAFVSIAAFLANTAIWRVKRSCSLVQFEGVRISAAFGADFGGQEFLEDRALYGTLEIIRSGLPQR